MVSNHQTHKCKECQEEFSTFIVLLKHVARHHVEEKVDSNEEGKTKDEVKQDNKIVKHKEEEPKSAKNKVFVFKGSKMNSEQNI
jgi:hypothetical protein